MHIHYTLLVTCSLLLCCCTSKQGKVAEEKQTGVVTESVAKVASPVKITFLLNSGNDYYMNVSEYDGKNSACKEAIKEHVATKMHLARPCTLHYLDEVPDFKLPEGGKMYGSTSIQRRVIAQVIIVGDVPNIIFDPLGYGKYTE